MKLLTKLVHWIKLLTGPGIRIRLTIHPVALAFIAAFILAAIAFAIGNPYPLTMLFILFVYIVILG